MSEAARKKVFKIRDFNAAAEDCLQVRVPENISVRHAAPVLARRLAEKTGKDLFGDGVDAVGIEWDGKILSPDQTFSEIPENSTLTLNPSANPAT